MNYSQLVSSIQAWVMRDDLAAIVPTWIEMAESTMNERLRIRQMVTRAQVNATDRFIPLPNDWLEAKNLELVGGRPLEYITPNEIDQKRNDKAQVPCGEISGWYTLYDDVLEVFPAPDEDNPKQYEMIYYAKVPALSAQRPTNEIIERNIAFYLYGALVHSAPFLIDDARVPVWSGFFEQALSDANSADEKARTSGGPLVRPQQSL